MLNVFDENINAMEHIDLIYDVKVSCKNNINHIPLTFVNKKVSHMLQHSTNKYSNCGHVHHVHAMAHTYPRKTHATARLCQDMCTLKLRYGFSIFFCL